MVLHRRGICFHAFDEGDPDGICAFQPSASKEAAAAFLATPCHAAYLRKVEPLLAGPPNVTRLSPKGIKAV